MLYTSFQAAEILDYKFHTFKDRVDRGFIVADIPANGAGSKAFYSKATLYKAQAARFLEASGIRRKPASEFASTINHWKEKVSAIRRVGPIDILIDTFEVVKFVDSRAAKYE